MVRSLLVALLFTLPSVLANGHQPLVSHKELSKHGDTSTSPRKDLVIDISDIGGPGVPPQGPSTISASKTPPVTTTPKTTSHAAKPTSSTPPPSKGPTSTRSRGHSPTLTPTSHTATQGHTKSSAPPKTVTPIPTPPPAGGGGEANDPDPTTSSSSTQQSHRPTLTTTKDSTPTSTPQVFPDIDACRADSDCGSGSSCCFFNDFANVCVAANQCSANGACHFSGQEGSCGARGPDRCFENSDCGANKPICCLLPNVGNICIKANACTTGKCLADAGDDIGVCDNPDADLSTDTPQCGSDSDCPGRKVCCDLGSAEPNQCIRLTACVHNACRSTSGRYGGCNGG